VLCAPCMYGGLRGALSCKKFTTSGDKNSITDPKHRSARRNLGDLDLSLLVHTMDASGDAYYGLPSDDLGHSSDPKQCSVRGCTQFLTDGTNNKMCDICRGRHRIYASTKRAKRKLEKAAVANTVTAHNGGDTVMLIHDTLSQRPPIVSPWVSPSAQSVQRVCFLSIEVDVTSGSGTFMQAFCPAMMLWVLPAEISR